MDKEEREQHKTEGRELYRIGQSSAQRARGVLMVIEAHYCRNLDAPNFEVYASHWLWACQAQYERQIVDLLIARFPLPRRPRIKRGCSDWNSFGDPNYKTAA